MAVVAFFAASILAIIGAVGVVSLGNPFFNVLALVVHLIALAALFLLLRAEFVAAAQIVVYAGAVMVLYVFVVAYVGGKDEPIGGATGGGSRALAFLFAGALLVEICIAVLGSGLQALNTEGAGYEPGIEAQGTPAYIGRLLLTKFLFPFEAASILLLVAAVGAVVLARRRGGAGIDDDRIPFLTALRPPGTGTMAEAASGRLGPEPPILTSGEPERGPTEAGGW
jgi:NADH:ubiquinone oxidoreductase subunit 6 (subunit J)